MVSLTKRGREEGNICLTGPINLCTIKSLCSTKESMCEYFRVGSVIRYDIPNSLLTLTACLTF